MKFLISNSGRTILWAIAIIVISTMSAMVVTWRAPALKLAARDALVRARGATRPPDEVVIVAIDEASVKRFGRFPWPRRLMAQALRKLSDAHPKVIALHALYSDPTNEHDDAALAEAIKRAGNVVVAAQLVEAPQGGADGWARPLPAIEKAAAATGHGNVLTDSDGVARSLTLRETDDEGNPLWAMAVEMIRVGDGLRPDDVRDAPEGVKIGSRLIPVEAETETDAFATREAESSPQIFRASRMAIDYIGPAGSFADRMVSIADVIDGRAEPEKFNGRYVLIGVTAAAMGDRVASPFSDRNGALTSGVEVSANAITTILRSRFYRETPDWIAALLAALLAAIVVGALILAQGNREFIKQIAALLGIAALTLWLSYFAFVRWMVAPPIVSTIISLVVAAPLALLLRSLMVSASLDDRIGEMTRESARLSPFAIESKAGDAEPAWWPRGAARKARALAALQERLFARTQFVDRALQSVEDGLLIADAAGSIAFANPRAAKIFGLTERSLLGSNLFDRLSEIEYGADKPAADRAGGLSRLLEDRVAIEREIIVGEAEPRYYTLRMAVVSDDASGSCAPLGVVATLSDITKQRELQRMQNDVMRLVTHEMKTPLTAIKGMSEVMMKFDPGAEKRREMSAAINEATQRMARMIDDYLDLTRLESGAREPRLAFHRIESLVEQNLLLLDPVAARRGVTLIRKLSPDLPPILADADLLARALTNLVANAIKYSPIDTDVLISVQAGEDNLFIAVADQGYGIPPEHQASIFEKFFRVPSVEDAETPGTGLGLALVREIAELHSGRVTVESEPGVGSIFTLRLPLNRKPT
ncbi:MAG TPA: CHASE2 domain-containing protein [Blastocatellia bacterium]|jgi:PAS domain S-box-containing protein|nr:CHASE2 domain-containing protein [Blastocatellia bacterium]